MYKALIACRAGVEYSLMLKIRVQDVVSSNQLPITIEHASLDAVPGFNGELLITLVDVAEELKAQRVPQTVIGIVNIMDKNEILTKLKEFLNSNK